jgi:ABC-type nitrate/sulfonate/bicarbonate transport system substrate-binding protein
MKMHRRTFLKTAGAAAGIAAIGAPAIAQAKTPIRVGYLHTLAVDGQMWLADHLGAFAKNGLEPEFKQFQTGLEIFQAMIGGSLDVLSTGAVISNFPARGHRLRPTGSHHPRFTQLHSRPFSCRIPARFLFFRLTLSPLKLTTRAG